MEGSAVKFLGAGIAMLGALGAGLGLGNVFSTWLSAIARNPAAEGKLRQVGFIGFAATELVLLMCFVVAALIIFAS
ncbi:MAG: F0F1 ATP synthase subunit C [Alphaproteobacteria bacterium]|nr:F0F1 ATP synthase subunit C [Alphaproteobacteria bacterium]